MLNFGFEGLHLITLEIIGPIVILLQTRPHILTRALFSEARARGTPRLFCTQTRSSRVLPAKPDNCTKPFGDRIGLY